MRRACLPMLAVALIGVASAAPKIAVVRIADIHRSMEATKAMEDEARAEREALNRDPRLRAYQSVLKELQQISLKLKAALEDTANPDESVREGLKRKYSLKLQEASTLHREFLDFREDRLREINARLVDGMETSLASISETAATVGKENGYDWVLDSSGRTNTGVPFILYSKDPQDLTSAVLTKLGLDPSTLSDTPTP